MTPPRTAQFSRRKALGGLLVGAASAAWRAPTIWVPKPTTLRVLGTHVTLQEELRVRAQADLGIKIEFSPGGSAAVLHQAATRPESFDLYEQWSNSMKVLWQANAIQPIEKRRLRYWDEINNLTKTGRVTPQAQLGLGDAPYRLLNVQPDGTLGARPSEHVSFLPYVHNVDSFGYNSALRSKGEAYKTESWSWLFDERHRGRVALVNAPTIGLFDAALAAQASGLMQFENIGDMTRAEIDRLFEILVAKKREGHFRGLWSSVPQSVEFMRSGDVEIQSMFSPAVSSLNGRGIDCVYAAPREGYRAWHGVMCLSAATTGRVRDAAYDYMNWWLSGWPGAFIARQGYYISNPERSREHLSDDEWRYWYQGRPAVNALRGTDGAVCVQPGEVRNGGSYLRRFSSIAVWNTVMDTYEYSLLRWNEFLLS
ncbi:MAG: hypothetical protein DHS20C15_16580 [Planctomycetota bacterium]|nr:MAG: hypothetical protein DHS20C15_16580 [Planctomycetota bacterium]